jgi:hypothetical protein
MMGAGVIVRAAGVKGTYFKSVIDFGLAAVCLELLSFDEMPNGMHLVFCRSLRPKTQQRKLLLYLEIASQKIKEIVRHSGAIVL